MDTDIIIVGAGPAGLSLARALEHSGLSIAIIDLQRRRSLAEPTDDGRDIMLTHRSIQHLVDLGIWAKLPSSEISLVREARVLNVDSKLSAPADGEAQPARNLGSLVSNQLIRRTLFECVEQQANITLKTGVTTVDAKASQAGSCVTLSSGEKLTGRLLIAADSRASTVRTALGIGTEMAWLDQAVLVCRIEHERDHRNIATEWFDHQQKCALLPLLGRQSSVVLTVAMEDAKRLAALSDVALGSKISGRCSHGLGPLRVIANSRHVYPVVTSFAKRFAVPGAALIGDAAVSMHPATRHGFNLGLAGATMLGQEICDAQRLGLDLAKSGLLRGYERSHRRLALLLYRTTNLLVRSCDEGWPPPHLTRHANLGLGRSYA